MKSKWLTWFCKNFTRLQKGKLFGRWLHMFCFTEIKLIIKKGSVSGSIRNICTSIEKYIIFFNDKIVQNEILLPSCVFLNRKSGWNQCGRYIHNAKKRLWLMKQNSNLINEVLFVLGSRDSKFTEQKAVQLRLLKISFWRKKQKYVKLLSQWELKFPNLAFAFEIIKH